MASQGYHTTAPSAMQDICPNSASILSHIAPSGPTLGRGQPRTGRAGRAFPGHEGHTQRPQRGDRKATETSNGHVAAPLLAVTALATPHRKLDNVLRALTENSKSSILISEECGRHGNKGCQLCTSSTTLMCVGGGGGPIILRTPVHSQRSPFDRVGARKALHRPVGAVNNRNYGSCVPSPTRAPRHNCIASKFKKEEISS
ncbi:hypothetical protein V499_02871 [Pseudogymnoascus sp. VKM F-103]|nr:hypothetical protein V499_02871 [Pseudogymnoascus sp. VKM F-103]